MTDNDGSQGELEYCGFLRRFAAWCVDTPLRILIGWAIVYLPMRLLIYSQARQTGATDVSYLWSMMPVAGKLFFMGLWLTAACLVPWLYNALQESSLRRATLGKTLLGVQVADLSGHRVSFGRASGRYFGTLIPTFGVGYLLALFTLRKQALHDLIAGCVVIRKPADPPS